MTGTWQDQWILQVRAHVCTSLAVRWVPWPEATVWNTMIKDKVVFKSTHGDFGGSIECRESKYIAKVIDHQGFQSHPSQPGSRFFSSIETLVTSQTNPMLIHLTNVYWVLLCAGHPARCWGKKTWSLLWKNLGNCEIERVAFLCPCNPRAIDLTSGLGSFLCPGRLCVSWRQVGNENAPHCITLRTWDVLENHWKGLENVQRIVSQKPLLGMWLVGILPSLGR